jgi:hypothetical protein
VYLPREGPTTESSQVNVYRGKHKEKVMEREEAQICHPPILQTTKGLSILVTREKARVYEGFVPYISSSEDAAL